MKTTTTTCYSFVRPVHSVDEIETPSSARAKALHGGERRHDSGVVHAQHHGAADCGSNAEVLEFSAPRKALSRGRRVRSAARQAIGDDAADLFALAVAKAGVSHSDIAAACDLSRQKVTEWIAGTAVPADCVVIMLDRLHTLGKWILVLCARRLPVDLRREVAIEILSECQ